MRELQGRRKFRRLAYSKVAIFLLLIVLVLLSRSVFGVYQKSKIANDHRGRSDKELNGLLDRKQKLTANISRLQTDRGLEEEIRKNFSVASSGESVIVVVDPKVETKIEDNVGENNTKGFWSKITDIFKNN